MHNLQPLNDIKLATAYTIHDLDDKAQTKAWSEWLEHLEIFIEPEYVLKYYAEEHLEQQGYWVDTDKKQLFWSIGNYNGSDDFAFKGTVDVRKWLKHHKESNNYRAFVNYCIRYDGNATVYIRWRHGSYNSVNVTSDSEFVDFPWESNNPSLRAETQLEEIEKLIREDAREHMQEVRRALQQDYEHQVSMEYFKERCDDDDVLFDEHGNEV